MSQRRLRGGGSKLSIDALSASFQSTNRGIRSRLPTSPVPPSQSTQIDFTSGSSSNTGSQSIPTRSTELLDPSGHPYWRTQRKDWSADGSEENKSSLELLLEWLELPNNWKQFHSGKDGMTASRMQGNCSAWLRARFCRTRREPAAVGRKVSLTF